MLCNQHRTNTSKQWQGWARWKSGLENGYGRVGHLGVWVAASPDLRLSAVSNQLVWGARLGESLGIWGWIIWSWGSQRAADLISWYRDISLVHQ